MCAFVVLGLVFPYQAKRLAWGTSLKWPILCRVGRKALTQSINSVRSVMYWSPSDSDVLASVEAVFDTNVRTGPWPCFLSFFTFCYLAVPFYGCPAKYESGMWRSLNLWNPLWWSSLNTAVSGPAIYTYLCLRTKSSTRLKTVKKVAPCFV